jgi:hypothetical protein
MSAKKFRVAIWCVLIPYTYIRHTPYILTPSPSGGGIGGLTLAVALSHYPDIDVDIYESAHKFTEIGAGIGLWARQSHLIYLFIQSRSPSPAQIRSLEDPTILRSRARLVQNNRKSPTRRRNRPFLHLPQERSARRGRVLYPVYQR